MPLSFFKKDRVALEGYSIFQHLSAEEKEKLRQAASLLSFKAGEVIFSEKSSGDTFYIIASGKVEISKIGLDKKKKQLSVLGPGEIFGELAVIDQDTRSATATALEKTELLCFQGEALRSFIQGAPEIVQTLLATQIRRLRHLDEKILAMEETQKIQEKIIATIEEERKRIARDVHDGPKQEIATLILKLDQAEMEIETNPEKAQERLRAAREKLKDVLKSMREFIFNLHPLTLKAKGLISSLTELAEKWKKEEGLAVTFSSQVEDVPDSLAPSLYAIVYEALSNVKKHAQASSVDILLQKKGARLLLKIRDNGQGFSVDEVLTRYEKRGSLGLSGMKERAELLGGTFQIHSTPGQGTEITVEVPYG